LDTRLKILAREDAVEVARRLRAEGSTLALTTGWFDPLAPAHARRLAGLKNGAAFLMVLIGDPPRPLLPARARAELVAALSAVDFVVIVDPERTDSLITELDAESVTRGEADDEQITRDLIRHVHSRQRAD
jgi:bifunctional ADP-heptose synthase (sugar kinase/adenylyltransferase)